MQIQEFIYFLQNKQIAPDVIFDIGSLHAREAIEFSKVYPDSKIYSFESNPDSYLNCVNNTKNIQNIKIINKAVNIYDGTCKFFPINTKQTITTWEDGNPGASSLFKASGDYDFIEKYVQDEIDVECIRIDSFCKKNNILKIDCVWMDLQGAELLALKSFGNLLQNVKVIHTELEMNKMYHDQCLFSDVDPYLFSLGFERVHGDTSVHFGTDFIYLNRFI